MTYFNSLDVDTIDNNLGDALRFLVNTLAQIIGSVVLIAIILPWFLVAMAIISVAYWFMAIFYRTSARELKRLGEPTRSLMPTSRFECLFRCYLAKLAVFPFFRVVGWAWHYSSI